MVKEEGLNEAISNYLIDKFEDNKSFKCLIHEEAQVTHSYERPDLIFIYSLKGADDLDATIEIVEIENKQRNTQFIGGISNMLKMLVKKEDVDC